MDSSKVGDGGKAGADAGKQQANWWPPTPANNNGSLNQGKLPQPGNLPLKTPISLLQEGCLKKGLTPAYELMATEGQVHEPTFMYRVTVQDMTACGSGKSKKIAKHLAAKGILEQIVATGNFGDWGIPGKTVGEAREYLNSLLAEGKTVPLAKGTKAGEETEGDPAENPIGRLQEKCTKNRWPLPEYDLVEERGQPHDRTFVVTVKLGRYEEKAEAKSKKIAKRMVAEQMMKRLSEIPRDDEETLIEDEEGNPGDAYPKDLEEQLSSLQANFTEVTVVPQKDDITLADLGEINVRALPLDESTKELLKRMSPAEQILEPAYFDIPRVSKTGEHQCLVQLSTTPVAVCYGSGDSKDAAHFAAARNALEYLKVMSKA